MGRENKIDKVKSKQEWIKIHGSFPHSSKFAFLGWKWTPKKCLCKIPHILNVDKVKK